VVTGSIRSRQPAAGSVMPAASGRQPAASRQQPAASTAAGSSRKQQAGAAARSLFGSRWGCLLPMLSVAKEADEQGKSTPGRPCGGAGPISAFAALFFSAAVCRVGMAPQHGWYDKQDKKDKKWDCLCGATGNFCTRLACRRCRKPRQQAEPKKEPPKPPSISKRQVEAMAREWGWAPVAEAAKAGAGACTEAQLGLRIARGRNDTRTLETVQGVDRLLLQMQQELEQLLKERSGSKPMRAQVKELADRVAKRRRGWPSWWRRRGARQSRSSWLIDLLLG